MKKIYLFILLCGISMSAIATSTPSGTKERKGRMEVNPGMATPAPSTLQGELSDEMLAKSPAAENSPAIVALKAPTNELKNPDRPSKPVVHFKSKKKENRFLKRVEKVRNRVFRKHEGGSALIGVLSMVFGILGMILLVMSLFVAILATGALAVFAFAGILGLAAVVLGAIGLGGSETSKAFALVGLIFGIVTTVVFLIVLMFLALFDAL